MWFRKLLCAATCNFSWNLIVSCLSPSSQQNGAAYFISAVPKPFQTTASSPFPVMVWTPVYHSHTYPLSVPDPNLCKPAVPAFPPDVAFIPVPLFPWKKTLQTHIQHASKVDKSQPSFFPYLPAERKTPKQNQLFKFYLPPFWTWPSAFSANCPVKFFNSRQWGHSPIPVVPRATYTGISEGNCLFHLQLL